MKLYTAFLALVFFTIGCSSNGDDNPSMDDPGTTIGDGAIENLTLDELTPLYNSVLETKALETPQAFNQAYSSGLTSAEINNCIREENKQWPVIFQGCANDGQGPLLTEYGAPISVISVESEADKCKQSISDNNNTEQCKIARVFRD